MDLSDFERDVIDRLARIETKQDGVSALVDVLQPRVDKLERRLQTFSDRMWSISIILPLLIPMAMDYAKKHLFGNP